MRRRSAKNFVLLYALPFGSGTVCANWSSINSDGIRNFSASNVRAIARNPWPVISVFVSYPMDCNARLTAASLKGRPGRIPGNTYSPPPVSGYNSLRISTACRDSGTRWSVFVFETVYFHSAQFRSKSFHLARRNSPGRQKRNGAMRSAARTIGPP